MKYELHRGYSLSKHWIPKNNILNPDRNKRRNNLPKQTKLLKNKALKSSTWVNMRCDWTIDKTTSEKWGTACTAAVKISQTYLVDLESSRT